MCLRPNYFFFAFLFSKLSYTFQSALMELASLTLAVPFKNITSTF